MMPKLLIQVPQYPVIASAGIAEGQTPKPSHRLRMEGRFGLLDDRSAGVLLNVFARDASRFL
jgi:hypothetical protein